jgi:pseudouridine synthase
MDGFQTKPLKCRKVAPNRARVVLTEGKNRQIRRMFQHAGYTVKELKRVRIMNLEDTRLMKGKVRPLTAEERVGLLKSVGL